MKTAFYNGKHNKQGMDFLTKVVVFDLAFLVVYTIINQMTFFFMGSVPDTLIQWVYTVFGLELLVTMAKTLLDIKYGRKNRGENTENWSDTE